MLFLVKTIKNWPPMALNSNVENINSNINDKSMFKSMVSKISWLQASVTLGENKLPKVFL